ncbi:hypothetical protein HMPREF7215_1457 [Pyramidobacter piscolens W5455]|uniref:DUF6305 domain-containing protein n=1 Tax=Pyramidobacter piscolens W5455 TaxID=352165 RepID=A0ABM9ZS97_9BACT|nr:DUF6305 family protein [Pyramidobacter piscolens]EFB89831.1 hypothetical protein HMPREF7215_1457 [Pyramidobacter piscolens W5455]
MKKISLSLLVIMLLCLALSACSFAAVTGAEAPKGDLPLLVTNAGQGPGGKMGRLLIRRAKAVDDLTYNAEPKPEDLVAGGFKTMIVVIGSSAKGLGASGITIDQEIVRLDAMMAKAKELGIQVIAAHIEGKARRGKPGSADERSIDAIIPLADQIVVNTEGDADGKFTNLAKEKNIPITYLDSAMDLGEFVKMMYAK